jgi:hypothetical protein
VVEFAPISIAYSVAGAVAGIVVTVPVASMSAAVPVKAVARVVGALSFEQVNRVPEDRQDDLQRLPYTTRTPWQIDDQSAVADAGGGTAEHR